MTSLKIHFSQSRRERRKTMPHNFSPAFSLRPLRLCENGF
jgi:hypothetical protein